MLAVLAFSGCRHKDLVEAELRTREFDLRDLRAELASVEAQNAALLRELRDVRRAAPGKISADQASQTYSLKQIVLGRGTGGFDDDGFPGDESIQIVLEPRDGDGHALKAPGSLHVEAHEHSPEGIKTFLSAWDLPPERIRRLWRTGLLSTGYVVVLPWQNWPTSEKIRITVRFTLLDGRVFETDKDITIRLTDPRLRKKGSLGAEPAVPMDGGELAPPRMLNPSAVPEGESRRPAPAARSGNVLSTTSYSLPYSSELLDAVRLLRPSPVTGQPYED